MNTRVHGSRSLAAWIVAVIGGLASLSLLAAFLLRAGPDGATPAPAGNETSKYAIGLNFPYHTDTSWMQGYFVREEGDRDGRTGTISVAWATTTEAVPLERLTTLPTFARLPPAEQDRFREYLRGFTITKLGTVLAADGLPREGADVLGGEVYLLMIAASDFGGRSYSTPSFEVVLSRDGGQAFALHPVRAYGPDVVPVFDEKYVQDRSLDPWGVVPFLPGFALRHSVRETFPLDRLRNGFLPFVAYDQPLEGWNRLPACSPWEPCVSLMHDREYTVATTTGSGIVIYAWPGAKKYQDTSHELWAVLPDRHLVWIAGGDVSVGGSGPETPAAVNYSRLTWRMYAHPDADIDAFVRKHQARMRTVSFQRGEALVFRRPDDPALAELFGRDETERFGRYLRQTDDATFPDLLFARNVLGEWEGYVKSGGYHGGDYAP